MESDEITAIFNDMARKKFNEQDEKLNRVRKYKAQRFCSDEEVETFISIFNTLFAERESVDYDYFVGQFKEPED